MLLLVLLIPTQPSAQPTPSSEWRAPRLPWGDPDLEGVYTNRSEAAIHLERPQQFAGRTRDSVTRDEISAFLRESFRRRDANPRTALEAVWGFQRDTAGHQPWFVIDPPDGRLPALSVEGERRRLAASDRLILNPPSDSYEDRSTNARCLSQGVLGATFPPLEERVVQIMQTEDYVVLRYEVLHEIRVIPFEGRAPTAAAIPATMGVANGYWEGDTLVVDAAHFTAGAINDTTAVGATLRVSERFRRTAPEVIEWSLTVEDPSTWTGPWTMAMPLLREPTGLIFEHGCHEGNYGLRNILSAARAQDQRLWGLVRVGADLRRYVLSAGWTWNQALTAGATGAATGLLLVAYALWHLLTQRRRSSPFNSSPGER